MSVVGRCSPLAEEAKDYDFGHLRRLNVTPEITGLWQLEVRGDTSISNYVSLDMAYIDTGSIWLEMKIVLLTIDVGFAGTGS